LANIGRSLPHDSAHGHVTGEALYVEDLPRLEGELWVSLVPSPLASGVLRGIDPREALALDGVVGVYTHRDLPGHNRFGPIFHDEPFLADERVDYVHQAVAVVAATTREVAMRARKLVKLDIEPTTPILTIDEAIAAESWLGPQRTIARGDVEAALAAAPHVLDGVFESGGQEQFYFEAQASLAIPGEGDEVRVFSSTQNPTETQAVVAEALGLRLHQVVCECKRMGGGFGGKETQSAIPAAMAALVAYKTRRPARIVLERDDDMRMTGKRHPYKSSWRIAFDDAGRVLGLDVEAHSNGGAFADLSTSIMERTMLHIDNAYFLPAVRVVGQVCKTNLPPNTAFRGFGGPQGIGIVENALQEVAQALGVDAWDVRRANLYRDGDPTRNTTPYGQVVRDHVLEETFDTLEESSDYRARMLAVTEHNLARPTRLRGLAVSPVKFGISFTTKFLNQGNALVNVYTDGSIQVSTGGTEMGQGLNTKVRQLVADEFGLSHESVVLMSTSTEKNHNTSPTAASAGTDLNGAAALDACRQIKRRMMEFAAELFADSTEGIVRSPEHVRFAGGFVYDERIADPAHQLAFGAFCDQARRERVDLGARGFYATPGVDFNRETGRGSPFFYYTTGAAVAEVSIDRFTGDVTVERVDLLMDIGRSINPGIDRGQVIGGFMQGVGWCTNEELRYAPGGVLTTNGPTTYKIPNITDLPRDLRVQFLDNPKHAINVGRSKAVGEPPLMLGIAVWLAIKHALSQAAPGAAIPLRIPATNEEVLMTLASSIAAPTSTSVSAARR
jgi:xanthine dehydrogenase large subunit